MTDSRFAKAAAYEKLMGRWSERVAPLFLEFSRLRDAGKVLDVGCGTGALVEIVAGRTDASTIVGIDPSQPFIDYARQRFPDPRFSFNCGDGMALPYPDASFDCALSLLVFPFIPKPIRAANEMRRVTHPGGTVGACVWDSGSGGLEMAKIFWDEAVKLDDSVVSEIPERSLHCNRPGQLTQVWRAAGLEGVEEVALEIQTDFRDFDDYWVPYSSGVGPQGVYNDRLSTALRQALRKALRKRLLGDGPDRPFSLRARALAVRGTVPLRQSS